MPISFARPVGAPADVAELEYVSALHQTKVKALREDGSILDEDIALFLTSRYGIRLTKEQVRERILESFGISKLSVHDEDDTMCLDMVELMSLLLVPKLRKDLIRMQQEGTKTEDKELPDPNELIPYVFNLIMHDVTGKTDPVPLTKQFLKQLFGVYGEQELANNDTLLNEMIQSVGTDASGTKVLDVNTFAQLLTKDIDLYDVDNEKRQTTNFSDVFHETKESLGKKANTSVRPLYYNEADVENQENEMNQVHDAEAEEKKVPIKFSANFIDLVADTYRSGFLMVALWTSFGVSFFTYYLQIDVDQVVPQCDSFEFRTPLTEQIGTLACVIGFAVVRWILVLLFQSAYGIVYFGFSGIGNDIETKNPYLPLIGMIAATLFTAIPPIISERDGGIEIKFLRAMSIVLGSCVVVLNFFQFYGLMTPYLKSVREGWEERFKQRRAPQAIRGEAIIKGAASLKVGKMIDNSVAIHRKRRDDSVIESFFGQALFNYAEVEDTEWDGGFRRTWTGIVSGRFFHEEGIWYSARLLSVNVTQFIVAVFVLLFGIVLTSRVVDEYDANADPLLGYFREFFDFGVDPALVSEIANETAQEVTRWFLLSFDSSGCAPVDDVVQNCEAAAALEPPMITNCIPDDSSADCTLFFYTTEAEPEADPFVQYLLLSEAGFNSTGLNGTASANLAEAALDSVRSLYPEEQYMILYPGLLAAVIAFVAATAIAVITLPSATTTILKLRSGVTPFMRDPKAKTLRIAPDQTAYMQGNAFWGILLSSGIMGVFVGFILFLFLWQVTAATMYRLAAGIIGIGCVIGLHWLLVKSTRIFSASAYYRHRPALANVVLLIRECAFFALTIWFVFVRAGKFIFTALLYVGRIDTPFLADGVGEIEIAGLRLDTSPYVFLMDILQHEAHRHPYIETLGVMYMMKLKHGRRFGDGIGSAWRALFVIALMPWLWKYRKLTRPYVRLEDEFGQNQEDDDATLALPVVPLEAGVTGYGLLTRQETVTGVKRISLLPGLTPQRQKSLSFHEAQALRTEFRSKAEEHAETEEQLRREIEQLRRQLQPVDEDSEGAVSKDIEDLRKQLQPVGEEVGSNLSLINDDEDEESVSKEIEDLRKQLQPFGQVDEGVGSNLSLINDDDGDFLAPPPFVRKQSRGLMELQSSKRASADH